MIQSSEKKELRTPRAHLSIPVPPFVFPRRRHRVSRAQATRREKLEPVDVFPVLADGRTLICFNEGRILEMNEKRWGKKKTGFYLWEVNG
jgi:hypothetical protein